MKKGFFKALLFITIIGFAPLTATAQDWTWEVSEEPLSANVTELAVNNAVYGIIDGDPSTLEGITYTSGGAELEDDNSDVVDITVGAGGIVYVITNTSVFTWDPEAPPGLAYADLVLQPIIPLFEESITGTFKHIAAGEGGLLYVLFETDETEPVQYLLRGTPPFLTDGVGVNFTPRVVNLRSNGNYVNCKITLPDNLTEAVDPDSLMITGLEAPDLGLDPIQGLEIRRADAPYGLRFDGKYHVKFYRSYKRLGDITQSLKYWLEELFSGVQERGKYEVKMTLQGSVNNGVQFFQGEASFMAIVHKAR